MADDKLISILAEGVEIWNKWRRENPGHIDLSRADLFGIGYRGDEPLWKGYITNLAGVDLSNAELDRAFIESVNLSGADLSGATLSRTNLRRANLSGANLSGADLYEADLYQANLAGASLKNARLTRARLVEVDLSNADLENSNIYGIAAWDLTVNEKTNQRNLVIKDPSRTWEPDITVDDLEVAQFVYLLLNRTKLRNVLDTITSKAVLLLGRFTPERKAVLDALADEIRNHNLLPIIFDFERSTNRDFTETIKILAGLSLFVIVDLTKPKSAPQELMATVPDYQIPFVPILEEGEDSYSMFVDLMKYDWVLKPLLKYRTKETLLANFKTVILDRAWKKHLELQRKKNEGLEAIAIEQLTGQKE